LAYEERQGVAASQHLQRTARERKRMDKELEAETPLPHVRRATSIPASTSRRA